MCKLNENELPPPALSLVSITPSPYGDSPLDPLRPSGSSPLKRGQLENAESTEYKTIQKELSPFKGDERSETTCSEAEGVTLNSQHSTIMKTNTTTNWGKILKVLIAVLTALAGSLGVVSCM